jgi:hypothetical protein
MYIPKGKIDPQVLYTEGNEWYYSTIRTPYIGYYHLDTYGRAWTGKTHTDQSILLQKSPVNSTPIPESVNTYSFTSNEYSSILSKNQLNQSYLTDIPVPDSLPPTQSDYNTGYYTRYILQLKLSSQSFFIEVNKNTYYSFQNSSQNVFFKFIELPWKLTGPLYDNPTTGVKGVVDSNTRSIKTTSQSNPDIEKYFTDLTLYYKT